MDHADRRRGRRRLRHAAGRACGGALLAALAPVGAVAHIEKRIDRLAPATKRASLRALNEELDYFFVPSNPMKILTSLAIPSGKALMPKSLRCRMNAVEKPVRWVPLGNSMVLPPLRSKLI